MLARIVVAAWLAAVLPAIAAPLIAELPGPVVIAGDGEPAKDAREAFLSLAGKDKAKVVLILDPANLVKTWVDQKADSLKTLVLKDGKKADDAAFVKPLAEATGVWLSTGKADEIRGTLLEKELEKLRARGGAIGGSGPGTAVLSELGFLPGFQLATKLDDRFKAAIDAEPAVVGIALESGSAIVGRGRTLRVLGDKAIHIYVAKGAGHPAATQEAKAGSLFDLFQLRRAAANRASRNPFPPAHPNEPVVKNGSLMIVGGGGAGPDIWKRFIELAGGPESTIVMIPTALGGAIPPAGRIPEITALRRNGAKHVVVLHTYDRKEADDPKFSEALLKAKGVWFGGGRQWRFVDAYECTLTEKRIREVLERGGAIGGSSAGASIQSEFMPRGHPLGNTVMAAEGYERGFGYLPGCAVDQHFFARKRTADMTGLMKQYPQFLGIGIDEGTAIVVKGSMAEVIGRTKVGFYDARKKHAGGADFEEVKVGEKYDLQKRAKVK